MKRRIAILRGGPGHERAHSMRSGKAALDVLKTEHDVIDIIVDTNGDWYVDGFKVRPEPIIALADGFLNTISGSYGEDGTAQSILERFGAQYAGSRGSAAATSLDKVAAKRAFADAGMKTPVWRAYELPQTGRREYIINLIEELFETFPFPAIVKPRRGGLSVGTGVYVSKNDILPALHAAFSMSPEVIVEEYIDGIEATCAVVEGMRGQALYAAPPAKVVRSPYSVHDFHTKHSDEQFFETPAPLCEKHKREIEDWAKKAHATLGMKDVSRSDFVVHPRRGVYLIETNSVPSYKQGDSFLAAFPAVGASEQEIYNAILRRILGRE
jgi:D-alanine-D-alanine ligase